jgi:hypothetical protein
MGRRPLGLGCTSLTRWSFESSVSFRQGCVGGSAGPVRAWSRCACPLRRNASKWRRARVVPHPSQLLDRASEDAEPEVDVGVVLPGGNAGATFSIAHVMSCL